MLLLQTVDLEANLFYAIKSNVIKLSNVLNIQTVFWVKNQCNVFWSSFRKTLICHDEYSTHLHVSKFIVNGNITHLCVRLWTLSLSMTIPLHHAIALAFSITLSINLTYSLVRQSHTESRGSVHTQWLVLGRIGRASNTHVRTQWNCENCAFTKQEKNG